MASSSNRDSKAQPYRPPKLFEARVPQASPQASDRDDATRLAVSHPSHEQAPDALSASADLPVSQKPLQESRSARLPQRDVGFGDYFE